MIFDSMPYQNQRPCNEVKNLSENFVCIWKTFINFLLFEFKFLTIKYMYMYIDENSPTISK